MNKNFYWGVATASYQIEGAYQEDGKGESIWDRATHIDGNIYRNQTGDIACDGYHRYKEDIRLMKELGVNAYRFSIAWTRIYPDGIGKINEKGLQFYVDVVDELLANGITPFVTLFHWDYPQKLYEKGGWLNPESDKWFENYTATVAQALKGKVKNYFTINEPQCIIDLGYKNAIHAPFLKLPLEDCMLATHHLLKANGRAVKAIKKIDPTAKVGMAVCGMVKMPLKPEDEELAYQTMFAVDKSTSERHFWSNTIFTEPPILGRYPKDVLDYFDINFHPEQKDMEIIKCDMDYYGVNIYSGDYIERTPNGGARNVQWENGAPETHMGWSVTPESVYYGAKFLKRKYNLPVIITENGVSLTEWQEEDGKINDYCRIDFLKRYLMQINRAVQEGIDLKGYFYWSFLDNFEWALGYSKKFGLVHMDYKTQKRTPKASFYYYQKFLKEQK